MVAIHSIMFHELNELPKQILMLLPLLLLLLLLLYVHSILTCNRASKYLYPLVLISLYSTVVAQFQDYFSR